MKTPKRRKFCHVGVFIFDFLIYYSIYKERADVLSGTR